jgi:hypothetical protein
VKVRGLGIFINVLKVLDILVGRVSKELEPLRCSEHAQVLRGAGDSGKLIIIDHMVLGRDGSSG